MLKKFSIIIVICINGIFLTSSFATDYINNFELSEEETSMEEEIPTEEVLETPEEEILEIPTETPVIKITKPETVKETKEVEETETITETITEEEPDFPTLENTETTNEISEEEVESEITEEMEAEVQTKFEMQAEDKEKTKETLLEKNISEEKAEEISTLDTEVKTEITEEEIEKVLERLEDNQTISKIESLKLSDIIGSEEVSEELKYRIKEVIDIAQSELDSYRTAMKNNYQTMTRRILEVRRELNRVQDFRDEAEYDLEVSRWMILTLSMGVVCLTFLIVIMWRSVTNIGKNEIEVLFAYEDLKKNLGKINEQIELLNKKSSIAKEEETKETE